jgi:hypothetical protein
MAKGRNKQGREVKKKKKKAKGAGAEVVANVQFRHHSVVTTPAEAPIKPPE